MPPQEKQTFNPQMLDPIGSQLDFSPPLLGSIELLNPHQLWEILWDLYIIAAS